MKWQDRGGLTGCSLGIAPFAEQLHLVSMLV
jgi:hypothetical protein